MSKVLVATRWYVVFLFSVLLLLITLPVMATGRGEHPHGGASSEMEQGGHGHKSWPETPPPYAGKRNQSWSDQAMIDQGKALYVENCLECHGQDGKGSGPMAKELAHPPADLSNHFHCLSGQGDDYLFWRISEGGEVPPFAATNSFMPSFKDIFNSNERWAVLTYVHAAFHVKDSENCERGENKHD